MVEISESRASQTYRCKTCDAEFVVLREETAVCCPVCRMNRIKSIDS